MTLVDWLFRPAMLVRAALVAGCFALSPYLVQRLPSLAKRAEYRVSFNQIRVTPTPLRPVPVNLVEQVSQYVEASGELSILDEGLTADVARAFRRHPWVSNVIRVRKLYPAGLIVELEYRKPAAMVQVPGGRIPIDENAVVLPSVDFSPDEALQYPLIQNVTSKAVNHPGLLWNDPALVAAARLAELLKGQLQGLKLEAIAVPRAQATTDAKDIPLELIGQGGSRIIWGRAPGSDHPGELEAAQKLRRLEKYLADFKDYVRPNGPYEIDIRHWQEISRRPMAKEQAQVKPAKPSKEAAKVQISEGKKKARH